MAGKAGNRVEQARTIGIRKAYRAPRGRRPKEHSDMLDVIVLAMGVAFFALSIGYAYACDRL